MADNMEGDHTDLMDFEHENFGEEEDLATGCSNADSGFDAVIGHIEDIIMEDDFQRLQNNFQEKYYQEFEDTEENKFIYTDIHREYVELVEKFLSEEISKRIPDFSMEEFLRALETKEGDCELDGEIFDLLRTFSDFLKFKEFMLDYREEKEGRTIDLSDGIMVTPVHNGDLLMEGAGLSLMGHGFGKH
ncbi:ADP-ribosylation factor-like protein 2-binding protein [Littorina saxatilis]|uniref:ADP-ribosylation factor-like protein 2-binding protein n=1 Tax=Littorina saxatilis TaxID=31220 RepID=A0AAN9C0A3_9CAEN